MLCIRIIFTNAVKDTPGIAEVVARSFDAEFRLHPEDDTVEIQGDADDEEIYNLCTLISDNVFSLLIKSAIMRMLSEKYNCFNRDECIRICNAVLQKDFVMELKGRLYVYLKVNKSLNPVGFFNFMCDDVLKKALLCAVEEADSILELNDENDMVDMLRCFLNMSEESVNKVSVYASAGILEIKECFPDRYNCNQEFADTDSDVLAELITLNPKSIEIYGKDEFLKNDMSAVIKAVFEDRIEYRR